MRGSVVVPLCPTSTEGGIDRKVDDNTLAPPRNGSGHHTDDTGIDSPYDCFGVQKEVTKDKGLTERKGKLNRE